MKKKYWVEQSKDLDRLYFVLWHDGNITNIAYEGTEDECERWIQNNS